jgi:hypothetical protein
MLPIKEVFVRITRNCFAKQVPYSIGQVVSLDAKIAYELIAAGAAQIFTAPVQTAESPQFKKAETATMKKHYK